MLIHDITDCIYRQIYVLLILTYFFSQPKMQYKMQFFSNTKCFLLSYKVLFRFTYTNICPFFIITSLSLFNHKIFWQMQAILWTLTDRDSIKTYCEKNRRTSYSKLLYSLVSPLSPSAHSLSFFTSMFSSIYLLLHICWPTFPLKCYFSLQQRAARLWASGWWALTYVTHWLPQLIQYGRVCEMGVHLLGHNCEVNGCLSGDLRRVCSSWKRAILSRCRKSEKRALKCRRGQTAYNRPSHWAWFSLMTTSTHRRYCIRLPKNLWFSSRLQRATGAGSCLILV